MLIRLVNCKESLLSGTHGAPINGRALYMDNSDYFTLLYGVILPLTYFHNLGLFHPTLWGPPSDPKKTNTCGKKNHGWKKLRFATTSRVCKFFQGRLVTRWGTLRDVLNQKICQKYCLKAAYELLTSWWLNQPTWKICSSNWESKPPT